jgi:hypothetical protein
MNELRQSFYLTKNTRGGINMCDCEQLVLLFRQSLLDLIKLGPVTNGRLQLRRHGAVRLESVRKRIRKIASVKDQDFVTWLGQVRCDLIPTKCARTGDNEGLRIGIGGLKELSELCERVAENVYEGLSSVSFTVECQ